MNRQFSRVNMYNLIRLQRNPDYNYMESSTYRSKNVSYYKKNCSKFWQESMFCIVVKPIQVSWMNQGRSWLLPTMLEHQGWELSMRCSKGNVFS